MDYHKIVKQLIGKINPVGETNTDNDRFKNLEELTSLVENLITDIDDMAFNNKDAHEFSIRRSVEHATKFLNRIRSVE
jgi:hypothetical protein